MSGSDKNVFQFLKENYNAIRSEVVLPFIVKFVYNNIEAYEVPFSPHAKYIAVKVYGKNDTFLKIINEFNLKESVGMDLNLNYLYNPAASLKRFIDLIVKETGVTSF
ncbi:MAG: hypothetical protein ABI863_23725 [Ginsengibacter sp.]